MANKLERRGLSLRTAEIRLDDSGTDPRIVGHASVFYDGTAATEFEIFDGLIERVMPGSFDKTLADGDDVRGLFNHDPNMILGRTSAETLALSIDKRGLRFEIEPGDTTVAEDVIKHIRRGDVTGSSFGFEVTDQTFRTVNKVDIREIRGVRLFDVGPVTFPAYEGAESQIRKEELAELRSLVQHWRSSRGDQQALRERAKRTNLTVQVQRLQSGQCY